MALAKKDKDTKGLARTPLKLGKKFRLVEVIVESIIKSLSFISIAAIVLIFVFVFKEAAPVFVGKKAAAKDTTSISKTSQTSSKGSSSVQQEVYDPLADEAATKSVSKSTPKKGKVSFEKKGKVAQEVYDPLADDAPVKKEEPKKEEITKVESAKEIVTPPPAKTKTPEKEIAANKSAKDSAGLVTEKREADSAAAHEISNEQKRELASNFWSMITGTNWQPVSDVPKYGFVPLFIGTLKVTLLALFFASPLAILAALFTSSFAPKWARETIKPVIELLAGFPSVVIGFFALIVLATIFQDAFGYTFRLNALVGGVAMAFAVIPIIYTISEDALVAVPQALRDASTALGATKWQTAFKVVLPAALPGVFAAIVLGFGRAFGETMIALMATGNAPITSANILEPVRTFAATIGAEMAEVVFGDEHYNVLFLIGSMLFVFTFTMNMLVEFYIRKRLIKRIQGK